MMYTNSESTDQEKRKSEETVEDYEEDVFVKNNKISRASVKQRLMNEHKLDRVLDILQQLTLDMNQIKLEHIKSNSELRELKIENGKMKKENNNIKEKNTKIRQKFSVNGKVIQRKKGKEIELHTLRTGGGGNSNKSLTELEFGCLIGVVKDSTFEYGRCLFKHTGKSFSVNGKVIQRKKGKEIELHTLRTGGGGNSNKSLTELEFGCLIGVVKDGTFECGRCLFKHTGKSFSVNGKVIQRKKGKEIELHTLRTGGGGNSNKSLTELEFGCLIGVVKDMRRDTSEWCMVHFKRGSVKIVATAKSRQPLLTSTCSKAFSKVVEGSQLNKCFGNDRLLCEDNLQPMLNIALFSGIFNDSKTFVDMKLVLTAEQTITDFNVLLNDTKGDLNKQQILEFVSEHFRDGDELESWTPNDFVLKPKFLERVANATCLQGKIKDDVGKQQEKYSILPVPNGFIVPGGRFREYYYWDSYWIIRSLLLSEMHETARGMIENFFTLIEKYGFIPNGGRKYYLNRSQPPLLTAMVHNYYKQNPNVEWLKKNVKYLEKELSFWLNHRTVNFQFGKYNFSLAHYKVGGTGPRPESYMEDVNVALFYQSEREQEEIYDELKSSAESGWDFSTRWFFDKSGGIKTNLTNIKISRVLPVDLNAILCKAFRDISQIYLILNETEKSLFWMQHHQQWKMAVSVVFWNNSDKIWYDMDKETMRHQKYFFPSNISPLWTRCYDESKANELGSFVVDYLRGQEILNYMGGIPTSLIHSGEQWDFPNAWPPLQDIVAEGLQSTENVEAKKVAKEIARKWINANLLGFTESGEMFEKYDAVSAGKYGGGGEYVVQSGFGWTNGVALKFIHEYYTDD
ncbi:hypothetical protein FQA39_LY16155 [Lamprigera yunnana]|nr:hypothetical protein FQA39_LY16155 [Lamprigera yunnana]